MNARPRRHLLTGRSTELGFIAVVIAAYLSALSALAYLRPPITQREITTLLAAGPRSVSERA